VRLRVVSCHLLVVSCATALAQSQTTAPTGLIIGQVVDAATNRPVPEAEVRLRTGTGQTPPNGRVIADPEGRYFFVGLAAGTYQLQATKGGYGDGFYGMRRPPRIAVLPGIDGLGLELSEGQRVLDATILVWKHASISGVVTDDSGEPIVGTIVRPFMRTIVNGRPRFVGSGRSIAVTDDRGIYRAIGLTPGDYVIAVAATHSTRPAFAVVVPGYQPAGVEFFGTGGREAPTLGSFRTQRFGDYMLTTEHGLPIPTVSSQTDRLAVYQTTYFPGVSVPSEAGIVSIAAGEDRGGVSIQMRLTPSVRVSGQLVGREVVGQQNLQLIPAATRDLPIPDPYQSAMSMTDMSGQFTFLAVPPGSYLLRVFAQLPATAGSSSRGEMLWASQPIAVGAADIDGVVVPLRPAVPIAGRVVVARGVDVQAGSQPTLETSVTFDPDDGIGMGFSARSDAKGAFTTGLPGGSYYVSAQPPRGWFISSVAAGGRVLNDSPVDVADALDIVVTVSNVSSRVEVTVRDAPAAVEGLARVMVFPADRPAWSDHGPRSPRFQTSRAGSGGDTFTGLPPGDYFIAAVREEHAIEWLDPKFLDLLSRVATRVTVFEGQSQSVAVRLSVVR